MLYPKSKSKKLDNTLFENPTSEYRGAPFWAWNCKLDKKTLKTQIEYLKEMGLGGFHMHSRTGMATEYLGSEFMELISACVEKAEKEKMLAWLYDEDRWPSGAAGGLVTKNPQFRARKLVFTPEEITGCVSKDESVKTGRPYLVACFDIALSEKGELARYSRLSSPDENAGGDKWYAYLMTQEASPWYNNQTYVDTLNGEAIEKFIEVTYEAYKKAVGDNFGNVIPAMFTDEPQFERKTTLNFATDKQPVTLPWTVDFPDTFKKANGFDIIDYLPELIWELPDAVSKARYLYHDHVSERFASAFADKCGKWCEENNLLLTGHLMEEPMLKSQTAALGEAMRSYRSFGLPGIDMLCDRIEYTTAKQAQSAARQYGREGVLSELYGVTNWDFDFRGHKFQGDWQAALGVTVRVHHLSWVSMAGEAKRDYPASINYQSPWYKDYSYVEDHFARVNTALTRGKPVVKVGVIHPIESYWLHWGPKQNTSTVRSQLEDMFQNITKWLLLGQIDFDFICESLLPDLCPNPSNPLKAGEMEYSVIIVPGCETLRSTTLDRLEKFRSMGGRLIFAGKYPEYVDAEKSNRAKLLFDKSESISFDNATLLSALENERDIKILNSDGTLADNFIYNMRDDNSKKWLFIAQGIKTNQPDTAPPQRIIINIKGMHTPLLYDTINGSIKPVDARYENNNTIIETDVYCNDSLLFRLDKESVSSYVIKKPEQPGLKLSKQIYFKNKVEYTLSEPNVLLLDIAEYALDNEEFRPEEEILRADNICRKELGFPPRQGAIAQPWTLGEEKISHYVTLKFTINSEIAVHDPLLAIEDARSVEITLNGAKISNEICGYYVDESIKTVNLGKIRQGENILTVKIPFGKTTNVEYCYILGSFNVKVEGCEKTITAPTSKIGFSSVTGQGLPFYGGNITYKCKISTPDCSLSLRTSCYRGAAVKVAIDGKPAGIIAYSPYTLLIDNVAAGEHTIELTLLGNRYNTFGQLHNAQTDAKWCGPNLWRTENEKWCYEYKLKDFGILCSPVIEVYE